MIIRKLTLYNFGVYASTNTFNFVNRVGKPIVLIGGMNGRGKTTFLEAVLLALYGANSFAYKESQFATYGQYLKSYVNQNDGTLKSSVELDFMMGPEEVYQVRREWNGSGMRTHERISVKKNGVLNEFLTQNWPLFIENILPSALSEFFFFDGEKIAELAVDETGEQMKESIRSMLGITVLDTLRTDIGRSISRIKKNSLGTAEQQEVERLQKQKESAEHKIAGYDKELALLENRVNESKATQEQLHIQYIAAGGDVLEQRQDLFQKKTALTAQIELSKDRLIEAAGTEVPLLMIEDLLKSICEQAEKEREHELVHQTILKMNDLFKQFQQEGGSVVGTDEFIDYVNRYAAEMDVQAIYGLSGHTLYQLQELTKGKLKGSRENLKGQMKERIQLLSKEYEIEKTLAVDINEKEVQRIYKEIKTAEAEEINLEVQIRSIREQRSAINGELIRTTAELKRRTEAMLTHMELHDEADRTIKYAHIATRIIDEYSVRLQRNKTQQLAETVTGCYRRLANKKNMIERIEMDPVTLDFTCYDDEGNEVSKKKLSAGEKQLMVISILWGLAICSKKKLPVIIDTPLSRLDSAHRKSVIDIYFPNASDQTIILSTDSEIDQNYYDVIRKHVGNEYTLVYDDETKSTTIEKGYFNGVIL